MSFSFHDWLEGQLIHLKNPQDVLTWVCYPEVVKESWTNFRLELSYVLRRAEDNGREENEDESWSIRQTAVYHKFTRGLVEADDRKSMFLLVAASSHAEDLYNQYLQNSVSDERQITAWNLHRILIADSVKGWTGYLASLEKRLTEKVSLQHMSPTNYSHTVQC